MEEHLSIDLAFDSVHQGFVVVAELHPAELTLGLSRVILGGGLRRGRLRFGALHGVGDLLEHPERTGLVRGSGAAVANLRVTAAAWVTLDDRWGLREWSADVGRSSLTTFDLDRDDPDASRLLGWRLLLHTLLLLLMHHVSMLLLLLLGR